MALQTQTIDLRFVSGADTKTDKNNVLFSGFQELKNVRMDKIGAVLPRGGFDNIGRPNSSSTYPSFSLTAEGDLTVVGTNSQYVIPNREANVPIGTAARGNFKREYAGECLPGFIDIASGIDGTSTPRICMVWLSTSNSQSGIGILVKNTDTDEVILQSFCPIGGIQSVRLAYNNGVFLVFYVDQFFDLHCRTVDTTNPANPLSADLTWATAPVAATSMIYAVTYDDVYAYLAYTTDAAPTVTTIQRVLLNSPTILTGTVGGTTITSAGNVTNIAACSTASSFTGVVVGANAAGIKGAFFDSSLALIGSIQSVASATFKYERLSLSKTPLNTYPITALLQYKDANGEQKTYYYGFGTSSNSGAPAFGATYRAVFTTGIATVDGVDYAIADSYTDPTYGSQAMVKVAYGFLTTMNGIVGRFGVDKNVGQALSGVVQQLPNPITVGSKIYFPSVVAGTINSLTPITVVNNTVQQVVAVPNYQASLLVWDTSELSQAVIDRRNNQNILVANSAKVVGAYERPGAVWPEIAFIASSDLSIVVSGALVDGTYSWVFAKLYKSPTGATYRSFSSIYTATLTAGHALRYVIRGSDIDIPAATTPSSYKNVDIEVYRTKANESIFYLSATKTNAATFDDTTSDTALGAGRIAEINGAGLSPSGMPSVRAVAFWKDRLAYVDPDNPNTVKFDLPGSAPSGLATASGLEITLNGAGGDIMALQQMDQALYIFKDNRILTLYGDPPGATGEGGSLSVPQTVFNGVGCSDPLSVVLTSRGVMFKSERGFYMILRNQEIAFVGQGPYDDRAQTIVGAGVGTDQSEVYFAHDNGSIWVYNMDTNAWYEWVYGSTLRGFAAPQGRLLGLSERDFFDIDTTLTQDNPYTGSNTEITTDLTTGWLRLNGILGYQRLKRFYMQFYQLASSEITVDCYTDYDDDTPVQTTTFTPLLDGLTGNGAFEIHMARQKCEAVKFRIRTAAYGFKWSGATLVVGTKMTGSKDINYISKF